MTELEAIVSEIKKTTAHQKAINRADEVKVMKSMLNDPDFTIGVYDRSNGYIGQKSPRKEAVKFVRDIVSGTTKLDNKDSQLLAEQYQFTTRNANFLLDNMRDFLYVYTGSGRKINIVQSATSETCLFAKYIPSAEKTVPDKDNPGTTKRIKTTPYTKIVATNKSPKYNTGE